MKNMVVPENIENALESYCRNHQCSRLEIKAALIDMDGVLYDSMPNHAKAWMNVCSDLGIDASYEEFFIYEGMTGAAIINLLHKRQFGMEVSAEEAARIYAIKADYFKSYDAGTLMPGAAKVLRILADSGILRVLVTGSGQKSLLDKLNNDYPGIFKEDMQITAHDVKNGKPNPEPYLKGEQKANAIPQQCIVIENAPLGVKAASASGAFVIAVATGPIPRWELKEAGADIVVDSMCMLAEMLPQFLEICSKYRYNVKQQIIFSNQLNSAIAYSMSSIGEYNKVFVITDENAVKCVLPLLNDIEAISVAEKIVIPAGESHKTLTTVESVWNLMQKSGATRKSVVINVGGGVVTDLGGFAASTFKRGMQFINIPTTLLGAVDAAVGGKTGINFNGYKNEIGVFREASSVIISTMFFSTLPVEELKSGYAEMLKHALLKSEDDLKKVLSYDIKNPDLFQLLPMLAESVNVKNDTVLKDPYETGLRKSLNLGHTVGHAFESLALNRNMPIPHGYAVAYGLVVELVLSHMKEGFDSSILRLVADFVSDNYGAFYITCDDYPELISLMCHDKKSENGELNFSLLSAPGNIKIGYVVEQAEVEIALDVYRDLLHI